jgi:hypothetical protein
LREVTHEYKRRNRYIQKVNEVLGFRYSQRNRPAPRTVNDLKEAIENLLILDLPERFETAEQVSLHHALFRVNELYNRVDFANLELEDASNRHAILHGVAEGYGELVSVKLFCAVQLVHEIVDAFRKQSSAGSEPE